MHHSRGIKRQVQEAVFAQVRTAVKVHAQGAARVGVQTDHGQRLGMLKPGQPSRTARAEKIQFPEMGNPDQPGKGSARDR